MSLHTVVTFASPPHPCTAGKYALPWDMASLNHRQFNPLYVLQRSAAFLNEATQTLRRRWGGEGSWRWNASSLSLKCGVSLSAALRML